MALSINKLISSRDLFVKVLFNLAHIFSAGFSSGEIYKLIKNFI